MGLAGLCLLAGLGMGAPILTRFDPLTVEPRARLLPPLSYADATGTSQRGARHLLGTDALGRDITARLLHGARASLPIGIGVGATAAFCGALAGLACGLSRSADATIMRVTEILLAVPPVLGALALRAAFGGGLGALVLALLLPEIPRLARVVRQVVRASLNEPFILAARAMGGDRAYVLRRHVLGQALGPLLVQASLAGASAILVEATLSFLGLGLGAGRPSWGGMMAEGRSLFRVAPHLVLLPAAALAWAVLAMHLISEGLQARLNPNVQ